MVYCGVPSKGCASCREKRTKCDRNIPSCGQCRRARRTCPGYRDEQSLAFRDETKRVVSRVQAAKASKSNKPPPVIEPIHSSKPLHEESNALVAADRAASSVPESFSIPIDEQASCFFFYHFASNDPVTPIPYSRYLPKLLALEPAYSDLPAIITAIGLAALSTLQSSPETLMIARQKQTAVLRSLNSSLQDPKTATTDATFLTVMLLGLFETMTCSSPQSLKSWTNHINGATTIACMRGREQLQSPLGRQIWAYLRNQILVDCMQRRRPVPPVVIQWSEYATQLTTDISPLREPDLFPIMTRMCALRCVEDNTNNDPAVLTIAKGIDADLVEWVNRIPESLRYSIKTTNDTENVLSGTYHVYPSMWAIGGYNMYRCSRILIHELMVRWLKKNITYDLPQLQESEAILAELNAEICASVPCIFGQVDNGPSSSSYSPRAGAGIWILWPLYLAATMDIATPTTRAWVIAQLDRLGRVMGIRQALSLAGVLRTQKEITAWDRFGSRNDEELEEW